MNLPVYVVLYAVFNPGKFLSHAITYEDPPGLFDREEIKEYAPCTRWATKRSA